MMMIEQMRKHSSDVFTLGHSPDPDDAFMFYAITNAKIDLRGISIRASAGRYSDVE